MARSDEPITAWGSPALFAQGAGAVLVALAASVVATVIVVFVLGGPLFATGSVWLTGSLFHAVAAAAWMGAGLTIRQRFAIAPVLIFLPGAMLQWVIGAGETPYNGIVETLGGCVGGAACWRFLVRRSTTRARALAVWVPTLAAVTLTGVSLSRGRVGIKRQLSDVRGTAQVDVLSGAYDPYYIWLPRGRPLSVGPDSAVMFEPDPGSGASRYKARPVTGTLFQAICDRFDDDASVRTEAAIRDGSFPRWITVLPAPRPVCESGTVWAVRQ